MSAPRTSRCPSCGQGFPVSPGTRLACGHPMAPLRASTIVTIPAAREEAARA
jgi:hypothetical protein